MSSTFKFRLDPTVPTQSGPLLPPTSPTSATTFTIPGYEPLAAPDATLPPKLAKGSLEYDAASRYTLSWLSMGKMLAWKCAEEKTKSIELCQKEVHKNKGAGLRIWGEKHIFVCARKGSGGNNGQHYVKKHDWGRKIESKMLGLYQEKHDHPIGSKNICFTRLPQETRAEIERLLWLGVDPKTVLTQIHGKGTYQEQNINNLDIMHTQSNFASRADIYQIQKAIEQETIRLASQDGASVLKWVQKLKDQGHFVMLKASADPSPVNAKLPLATDSFVLIIQTKYQQECWRRHGNNFAGFDATHNTTHYENMSLFTLLVRDQWGHGMPAAWMISSNGQEETIDYFLDTVRTQFPTIAPKQFMSDKDRAQMNAIQRRYPDSRLLLCWWHVLHVWQQHFVTHHYPDLWDLLKKWLRLTDETDFQTYWVKIKAIAPPSVIEYLQENWLEEQHLWSAVARQDCTIFELSDTNMLVEAWHHLLKGDFLKGKRNRRLDHLLYTLTQKAIPHFIAHHHRQAHGFEGPNLALKQRIGSPPDAVYGNAVNLVVNKP